MKQLKLTLSDSAYNKALELAAASALPIEGFLPTLLQDLLDKAAQPSNTQPVHVSNAIPIKPGPLPSFRSIMPDTLEQALAVCEYVYEGKGVPKDEMNARAQFREAVRHVAKIRDINETTVRDKCCTDRRLGLPGVSVNLETFVSWLCKPELLRDHLCRKFVNCVSDIHKRFAQFLPDRFPAKPGES
jgi:hypothetical protein